MAKLKRGKYYIGDPCYIFDKSWDKILDDTDHFNDGKIVTLFGKECIAGSTAHGDGVYLDNYNREYAVDAGLVGAIPVCLIFVDKCYTLKEINKNKEMHIINFKEDFEVSIEDGVFYFGHIIIDTDFTYTDEDLRF